MSSLSAAITHIAQEENNTSDFQNLSVTGDTPNNVTNKYSADEPLYLHPDLTKLPSGVTTESFHMQDPDEFSFHMADAREKQRGGSHELSYYLDLIEDSD